LYVGTLEGLVRLERLAVDAPWQEQSRTLAGKHVSALLFEPSRGGLFAGMHRGGLYRSLDGGATWEPRARGLDQDQIWTLASRERHGAVELYAGAEPAHLYRSRDYGETWTEIGSLLAVPGQERWMFPVPPRVPHVKNLAFDPLDTDVWYVGIEQGALLRTADDGRTRPTTCSTRMCTGSRCRRGTGSGST
jgi:hypothetical protein